MNDEACVITINGADYYYPCDRRDYIILVGNTLVNTSSSSITLYRDFPIYGDNSSGYPRITMPSNSGAYIRNSQNATQTPLSVTSAAFKTANYGFTSYLNICIFFALILLFFKKGR